MRARKRERVPNNDQPQANSRNRRNRPKSSGKGGGRGNSRNRRSGGRGPKGGGRPKKDDVGFFGDPSRLPEARSDVRITDDPAAVARSLGPPPLPGYEKVAEHYFAVVYDRAVATAGALAAAGGLIEPEDLEE